MKTHKVITKTSGSAPQEKVWQLLQKLSTLQTVAAPLATFTPTDDVNDVIWLEGKTFSFRLRLFGIMPFGIHTIRVIEFDHAAYRIYTNETNSHVPVWNHRITLNPLSYDQTEYTDEVEIYAGWKTSFVALGKMVLCISAAKVAEIHMAV